MTVNAPHYTRRRAGFTLIEIMTSCVIGMAVIIIVYSLLHRSQSNYQRTVQTTLEAAIIQQAGLVLRTDLNRYEPRLPLTIADGVNNLGFAFVNGQRTPWDAGSGTLYPSESSKAFPSDRLGFFIHLPATQAQHYNGATLAHVLYFTAQTDDDTPEVLRPLVASGRMDHSRKLFRLFTPPDRLGARLRLLDRSAENGQGNPALPRGYNTLLSTVSPDDQAWDYPSHLSPSTLSLVAPKVAQFTVSLTPQPLSIQPQPSALSIHQLLTTSQPETLRPVHQSLTLTIQLCPPAKAHLLTAEDWNRAGSTQPNSLGDDSIRLRQHTFTHALLK